jgi:hypothetical protein
MCFLVVEENSCRVQGQTMSSESLGLSILRDIQRPKVETVLSQGLLNRASHEYHYVYDTRKLLILPNA